MVRVYAPEGMQEQHKLTLNGRLSIIIRRDGCLERLVVYLIGAEIDYQENIQGAQFVIKNPNAKTTCGCGSSFSA